MPRKIRWEYMNEEGSWTQYVRGHSKEIEEMYEYGAPHCLMRPDDLSLWATGAFQKDAKDGFMVGQTPPPGVCTHRILITLS